MANVSKNAETLISLEFSGGLDSLTLNQERELNLKIYANNINLGQLVAYVRRHIIGSKKDHFSENPTPNSSNDGNRAKNIKVECNIALFNGLLDSGEVSHVKPGILVLVNDVDYELLNREHTLIENNNRNCNGPCPLINNPLPNKFKGLSICYFVIILLTVTSISGSAALDLHCAPLFAIIPHSIVSSVISIVTFIYYLIVSTKQLGTEIEWSIFSILSLSLAIIDIMISCWGFYTLEMAASKIYKAFKEELQIEPECLQTIAIIFLFSSFLILLLHIIISGACFILSILLNKAIKKQLSEMRLLS